MTNLDCYPPRLTSNAISFLLASLSDYAHSHGLIIRDSSTIEENQVARIPPVTLFPSLFPRRAWEHAVGLQTIYNELYARVANDVEWLGEILTDATQVDEFIKRLWDIDQEIRRDGIVQRATLGIFRSDYMIDREATPYPAIKQVEFNTISCGSGGLTSAVSGLHHYLHSTGAYGKDSPITTDSLPANPAAERLADGLAQAHAQYGKGNAVVLFVVQDPEMNIFDQRCLEYRLLEEHGIQTVRMTLYEIGASAELGINCALMVPTIAGGSVKAEISVVYLRAGYGPGDYPTETDWEGRRRLERSRAIKCPTIVTQLAGCKKVQQALAVPGAVERFLDSEKAEKVRKTFTGIYPLDDTPEGLRARALVLANPEYYVVKPQREGGGNNIYRSSIPRFLQSLPAQSHCNSYILMDLIRPPPHVNSIVRDGGLHTATVVSEFGVYGVMLWDNTDGRILLNKEAGWLLRSKPHGNDEGGILTQGGCLDSVSLM